MAFSNSPLVSFTRISPNRTQGRNHAIDTITIHCVVGQCSVESLGAVFATTERQASSNYGVGYDGRIGMYCEEKDRSWCSSNRENDHRAITIEVASDTSHPYAVTDAAYNALIDLCADICKRNGIRQLLWKADKSLIGQVDKQNMTVHRWFANKECPGKYLYDRHSDIAAKVNAKLGTEVEEAPSEPAPEVKPQEYPEILTDGVYRVRETWENAKSQVGAYRILSNAKRRADQYPGYRVYTDDGVAIYPATDDPVPEPDEEHRIYTVKRGDTLWEIAKAELGNGSRYTEIKELNNLTSNTIYVGWKLKIPN